MKIAIASGKGGTGKTTVTLSLARSLGQDVTVLDCDVEEPNDHLFVQGELLGQTAVGLPVPEVNEALCQACGECGRFCQYNAIVSFGKKPLLFPDLCHGCGGCMRVCPQQAIREMEQRIGEIVAMEAGPVRLIQGRIDVGKALVPPLIRAVKRYPDNGRVTLLDAPPGTSCPVVVTLHGVDFVVLVTEPTPFGLHDLELAVAVVRELELPFGVVVNRAGSGDGRVHTFCAREQIPILVEIPDDRRIATACSRGEILVDALPEYRTLFEQVWQGIREGGSARES